MNGKEDFRVGFKNNLILHNNDIPPKPGAVSLFITI